MVRRSLQHVTYGLLISMALIVSLCALPACTTQAAAKPCTRASASSASSQPGGNGSAEASAEDVGITLPANAILLPVVRQATGYTCGVACVQSILLYNGIDYRQDCLADVLGSTYETGTDARNIVNFLNDLDCDDIEDADGAYWMGWGTKFHSGIGAELESNMTVEDLHDAIDAGHPVICDIQAWYGVSGYDYTDEWESGHYVIAIAYDDARIYFMDPSTPGVYTYIDASKLVSRWHDYDGLTLDTGTKYYQMGIVITNPNPVFTSSAIEPLE